MPATIAPFILSYHYMDSTGKINNLKGIKLVLVNLNISSPKKQINILFKYRIRLVGKRWIFLLIFIHCLFWYTFVADLSEELIFKGGGALV